MGTEVNPQPCFPLTGARERDGLHELQTVGILVKTSWGAGLMVRREYLSSALLQRLGLGGAPDDAWWVYCETARKWRLCEPAGMGTAHAGDMP